MKKTLLAATCVGAAIFSSSALAADPAVESNNASWYVSLFGGGAFLEDYQPELQGAIAPNGYTTEFDTGFIVGGAIGTSLTENFRVEAEVSYLEAEIDSHVGGAPFNFVGTGVDGDFSALMVMGNVWYDINLNTFVVPYLGGGVGVAFTNSDLSTTNGQGQQWDDSDTNFAFQAGAGLMFPVSESIGLSLDYRFRGILDAEFGGSAAFPYTGNDVFVHTVQGGVTIQLGGL